MTHQSPSLLLRLARKLPFISRLVTAFAERKRLAAPESLPDTAPPMAQEARPAPTGKTTTARPKAREAKPAAPPPDAKTHAPACPHCRKTMVMKVARSGAKAGDNFWGCADYPQCRGIRAIFAPMPSQPVRSKPANKRQR
ncbi:topoisomerase domain-containing protein [Pseudomonas sp. StFLB209]|uniref:topoisomerase DNA-binding C4 zinc finger domain-containing protein n=1 Tax=Pseudomonas sp. StFLB209 TaxID=1028989 RepID=UPI0004F76A1B|nr:topoisomerase DNA-binding C4 zinc finger domain-containing protein [Pseudomonas sp. StFLB209]BAP44878.1 topoisomerase domain-containing protein [Pseudomonas sp. StFLB209]